jgi:glycosyltransferase involved in cell wall biosynthesis
MDKPLITVVIPVYNVELFIDQTLISILDQSFVNYECLFIDDKSTDNTVKIIRSYNDPRIKVILKKKNTGYTDSLNYGIKIAKGEFIARMDGDDIMDKYRFEKQIDFLEKNPEVGVCGSNYIVFPSDKYKILKQSHKDILTSLFFECEVAHPSVMIRKSVLSPEDNYEINKEPAEDYNLWTKLILKTKFHNIQEPLLFYRVHHNQVSKIKKSLQIESAFEARFFLWNYFLKSNQISFDFFKDIFNDNYTGSLFNLQKQLESLKLIEMEILESDELNIEILQRRIYDLKKFKVRGYFFKNKSMSISQIPILLFKYRSFFSFLDFIKITYTTIRYDRANSDNIHISK